MSFRDIIKKSVLQSFTGSSITTTTVCVTLGITVILALYIFAVYYLSTRKTFYNKTFNVSLAAISVITASIILAMQSNLAISLGMVGALSIVRFRTAIKDPSDTVYIFWAIVEGLCVGAQIYKLAVISTIFIAIVLLVSSYYSNTQKKYLIIIRGGKEIELGQIKAAVEPYYPKMRVRASNYAGERCEIICEVSARQEMNEEAISALKDCGHVNGVNWLLEMGERIG